MWELVCIAILGITLFIDLLSGNPGRAGTAGIILVGVLIWLIVSMVKDAKAKRKQAREDREAWEQYLRGAEERRQQQEQWRTDYEARKARAKELSKRYPGLGWNNYLRLAALTDEEIEERRAQYGKFWYIK